MRILKSIALVAATLFATHALAQTITIEPGSSVLIDQDNPPDRVSCESSGDTGPLQTATRRTCGHNYGSECSYYNTETISGKYCATGKKCAHNYGSACSFYNTLAECGNNNCSVSRVCAHSYGSECNFYNEIPTCN